LETSAPIGTQMRASLAPDINDQIKRFAAARFPNLPLEKALQRYGVIDGNIVYADDQGRMQRETPSLGNATGPVDAFMRAVRNVGAGTGPAAPQLGAAAVGTLMGPTALSIPAAAGTAASLDIFRQALDRFLAGESPGHLDFANAAG